MIKSYHTILDFSCNMNRIKKINLKLLTTKLNFNFSSDLYDKMLFYLFQILTLESHQSKIGKVVLYTHFGPKITQLLTFLNFLFPSSESSTSKETLSPVKSQTSLASSTSNLSFSITSLHRLKIVVLAGNQISGQIPTSLLRLQRLYTLYLQDNNLTGSLHLTEEEDLGMICVILLGRLQKKKKKMVWFWFETREVEEAAARRRRRTATG